MQRSHILLQTNIKVCLGMIYKTIHFKITPHGIKVFILLQFGALQTFLAVRLFACVKTKFQHNKQGYQMLSIINPELGIGWKI